MNAPCPVTLGELLDEIDRLGSSYARCHPLHVALFQLWLELRAHNKDQLPEDQPWARRS